MDKKVILVADDIEMNRSVMRRFLNHDFEILEADDGKMALDILDEKRVDVLLLDIIMPEIDEFIVLMSKLPSKEIARQKCKDIVRIMKYKPNLTIPANVSISIGLAFSEYKLTDYHALFQKADEALYISKQRGKARMTEYGMEAEEGQVDERAGIALCSRIRNVCSTVESVVPRSYHFVDCVDLNELEAKLPEMKDKLEMVYIDVSDSVDNGVSIWNKAKEMKDLKEIKLVALCQEGNMEQYKEAVLSGLVKDVLTTPINVEQLKRRLDQVLKEK